MNLDLFCITLIQSDTKKRSKKLKFEISCNFRWDWRFSDMFVTEFYSNLKKTVTFFLQNNFFLIFMKIQDFCQLTLNARLNLDILRSTFAKSTKNSSTWKFKENSHEKLKKFYWNKKKKLENMNNVWNFSKDNKTQWNFTKTNNKNHPNFPPALEISLQSFKPSKVWHNFSISP